MTVIPFLCCNRAGGGVTLLASVLGVAVTVALIGELAS